MGLCGSRWFCAGSWWVLLGPWWVLVGPWWVLVGPCWVLVGPGGSWWVLAGSLLGHPFSNNEPNNQVIQRATVDHLQDMFCVKNVQLKWPKSKKKLALIHHWHPAPNELTWASRQKCICQSINKVSTFLLSDVYFSSSFLCWIFWKQGQRFFTEELISHLLSTRCNKKHKENVLTLHKQLGVILWIVYW